MGTASEIPAAGKTARLALFAFLVVRLLLVLLTLRDPTGGVLVDSADYMHLAQGLLTSGRYQDPLGQAADLIRPPGYPALLAGVGAVAGNAPWAVTLVQLILSGAAALLLLGVGERVNRPTFGLVSAWILALSPNLALWSLTVMSETLFAGLLALGLYLWVRALREGRQRDFAWVGLVLGAATLARPIGLILIPIWAVVTYWALRRKLAGPKALAMETMLLAAGTLVVIGWMARNQLVHGSWTFTNVSSKTVIGFDLADVVARGEGITRSQAAEQLQGGQILQQTLSVAAAYPVPFIRAQLLGLARTAAGTDIGTWGNVLDWDRWSGLGLLTGLLGRTPAGDFSAAPQTAREEIIRGGLLVYGLAFGLALMALSLLGLVFAWRDKTWLGSTLLMAAISAATLMVVPLAAGQARFRVPAEPFLALLAGWGLISLAARWRRRARSSVAEDELPNPAAERVEAQHA